MNIGRRLKEFLGELYGMDESDAQDIIDAVSITCKFNGGTLFLDEEGMRELHVESVRRGFESDNDNLSRAITMLSRGKIVLVGSICDDEGTDITTTEGYEILCAMIQSENGGSNIMEMDVDNEID